MNPTARRSPSGIKTNHCIFSMFALIKTNGATHIAISIPLEGADKTIPALVGMLENNATFVNQGYNTIRTVEPQMSIDLKYSISMVNSDEELLINKNNYLANRYIISEPFFEIDSPAVLISNKKGIERRDSEIKRLNTELSHVKQQLDDLRNAIEEAASEA